MKLLFFLALAVLLPVLIMLTLSRPSPSMSLERRLASYSAGSTLPEHDPAVERFRRLLDRLEKKCSNPRRQIAEICLLTYRQEKERGTLLTFEEFVESLDARIPDDLAVRVDLRKIGRAMLAR